MDEQVTISKTELRLLATIAAERAEEMLDYAGDDPIKIDNGLGLQGIAAYWLKVAA